MLVKVSGIALRGRGNLVVERGKGNLTIERGRGNLTIERGKGGQDTVLVRKEKSPKLNPTELGKHLCELGDQLFTGTCYSSPKNHRTKEPRPKVPPAFNIYQQQAVDFFLIVFPRSPRKMQVKSAEPIHWQHTNSVKFLLWEKTSMGK
ncbi:uncharacterized protein [Spinacia oleracea]|uniref:Uncharacterized protein n=1 Tax=Spinacia oleracea TaxID=3562 RepID=A0ABM3RM64_SPIOL|nr:uncharacterized protein LOC130470494 [Spinacia oleracea]